MNELVPPLHGQAGGRMLILLGNPGFAPTEQFMFIHIGATNVRLLRSPTGSSANFLSSAAFWFYESCSFQSLLASKPSRQSLQGIADEDNSGRMNRGAATLLNKQRL